MPDSPRPSVLRALRTVGLCACVALAPVGCGEGEEAVASGVRPDAPRLIALALDSATSSMEGPLPGQVWFDVEGALEALGARPDDALRAGTLEALGEVFPGIRAGTFEEHVDCESSLRCDPTDDFFYGVDEYEVLPNGEILVQIGLDQVVSGSHRGFTVGTWFAPAAPDPGSAGWRFLRRGPYLVS